MKFICTQENLLKGLAHVVPVAGKNTQLPILKYVLLQVKDHVLHLTATDLEIGIHAIIGGKMTSEGSCVVPARPVMDYVQQLPRANSITLEFKDNVCFVSTKGFKAQFPTLPADDFPLLPTISQESAVPLNPAQFGEALIHVLFAATKEDVRPEIKSVFIKAEKDTLTLAATDSFRLSEYVLPYSSGQAWQFILPLSSAQEVVRLFSQQEALVVLPHENHVTFQSDGVEMTTRLLDGSYPDYGQIIPQNWQTKITVSREEFLRALKTLMVFLSRDSRRVQIETKLSDKQLWLKVMSGPAGEGEVELEVAGEGKDVTVLLNIQYLMEGVQHIGTSEVEIWFGSESDPVVVRPIGSKRSYTYVIMPIQA